MREGDIDAGENVDAGGDIKAGGPPVAEGTLPEGADLDAAAVGVALDVLAFCYAEVSQHLPA